MANKLFEYYAPERVNMLLEKSQDGKDLYMKGIFVQADVRNQNQRIYPLSEIAKAVENMQSRIKNGGIPGELDHPAELSINLDRVSHSIVEMHMEGKNGIGKLKIVDGHPCGVMARAIIEAGIKLGVSSRGSGNVDNNGYVSDFDIITVDIVAQPSAPEAFPRPIYESLYNMKGAPALVETAMAVAMKEKNSDLHFAKNMVKFIKELKKT